MQNHADANLIALIESTEDLIWSVDLDFRLITFNRALQKYHEVNYGVRLAAGMVPTDSLPMERATLWPPLYERALSQGHFRSEYSLTDGRTLALALNPILVDGKTTGVSVFGKDITERKNAEKDLLKEKEKFQAIFDGALEGMYQTSAEGRILTANRALARMLGYESTEELIGAVQNTALEVWADPDDRARALAQLNGGGCFETTSASSSAGMALFSGSRSISEE